MLEQRIRLFPIVRCLGGMLALSLVALGVARAVEWGERDVVRAESGRRSASWITDMPSGPDWRGIELQNVALPPADAEARALTDAHRRRFETVAAGQARPDVVQASRSGTTDGASRPVTDFSEVMLVASPTNPDHLLGSSKFFHTPAQYGFYTGVLESFDGGRTWTQEQPPGVEDYRLTSDPVNAFDDVGNGYFTLLTRGAGGFTGLDMLKKPANGSWQAPVEVDSTTYTDKQWIAADQDLQGLSPYAGHLYMSWTDVDGGHKIVFSRSTDGNQSWSAPLELGRGQVQGSTPAVGPDGVVYVAWGQGIFGGPSGTLRVARSLDGGRTFSEPEIAVDVRPIPFYLPNGLEDRNFRAPASLPAFTVNAADGALVLAWSDWRNGDADIYLAMSRDRGANWSEPTRMNDDPVGNGVDQIQPQLAAAPNGRLAVMWLDRRMACPDTPDIAPANRGRENFCLDAFMTRSYDRGRTWAPNIRAGQRAYDWSVNLPIVSTQDGFSTGFIGDYQGLASTDVADYPFWSATVDLGENPDFRQQVFTAIVTAGQYDGVPSPTPTATDGPSPTPSPTPSATMTPTGIATATETPTPDAPVTATSTGSATATATSTEIATATPSPTVTSTVSATPSATPKPTGEASPTTVTPTSPGPTPSGTNEATPDPAPATMTAAAARTATAGANGDPAVGRLWLPRVVR